MSVAFLIYQEVGLTLTVFKKKPYRLFGMQLLKYMHILSKNRFTLFGMWLFKCTHILSKNRFTLFGMWLFKCTHILSKNRFTLFGMSLFKVHAHLIQKPLHTFWDVRVSPLNSLSRPDHPARQYGQPIRHLFAPTPRLPAFPS